MRHELRMIGEIFILFLCLHRYLRYAPFRPWKTRGTTLVPHLPRESKWIKICAAMCSRSQRSHLGQVWIVSISTRSRHPCADDFSIITTLGVSKPAPGDTQKSNVFFPLFMAVCSPPFTLRIHTSSHTNRAPQRKSGIFVPLLECRFQRGILGTWMNMLLISSDRYIYALMGQITFPLLEGEREV